MAETAAQWSDYVRRLSRWPRTLLFGLRAACASTPTAASSGSGRSTRRDTRYSEWQRGNWSRRLTTPTSRLAGNFRSSVASPRRAGISAAFGIWLLALTATIGATDSRALSVESFTGTHVNGTNQVPYPDGVTAGDTLVITAIAWATGTGTPGGSAMPWAIPDGFSEVLNQAVTNANGVTGRVAVFTRSADGSEAGTVAVAGWDGYNLVGWSAGDVSVYMVRVSGGGAVSAVAAASNIGSTWTCQGITTPADNSLILLHVGSTVRNIKAQAPAGMTALENPGNTKRSLFRQDIATAGDTGTRSGAYQFGAGSAGCIMVAVSS